MIMRNQSLENLLTAKKEEDAKRFEKTMALIKNAKEHVLDMEEIKKLAEAIHNEVFCMELQQKVMDEKEFARRVGAIKTLSKNLLNLVKAKEKLVKEENS